MSNTDLIDNLLVEWETARERGRHLSAEELCKDCPELIMEIQP